jgi:hypothetical protein
MRHLLDRERVTLVFRELLPGSNPKDEAIWRLHLNACSDCRVKLEELQRRLSPPRVAIRAPSAVGMGSAAGANQDDVCLVARCG